MEPRTNNRGTLGRQPSVAVVGAGISGLTAAYLLARRHNVILFEADKRLGGHAHTHDVVDSDGQQLSVDSAFIVHNDLTYPWLHKLFGELDVEVRPTEMSMSVRCEGCGLEYAGGRRVRRWRGGVPGVLLGSPRDDAGNLVMLGTGQQHWSTVHAADLADFFRRVLETTRLAAITSSAMERTQPLPNLPKRPQSQSALQEPSPAPTKRLGRA
jgi:NAD(P)-binding Rossmann-like domain